MPQPIAYLSFNGNCADAMKFYERALDGKLELMMTFGDSPMCAQMPKQSHSLIMHARLALEGGNSLGALYAGDCPANAPSRQKPREPYLEETTLDPRERFEQCVREFAEQHGPRFAVLVDVLEEGE